MSPEVMRSWQITAVINRQVATQMSGTIKRHVESREDKGEEAAAGGGVGKLTDDSESCDWMQAGVMSESRQMENSSRPTTNSKKLVCYSRRALFWLARSLQISFLASILCCAQIYGMRYTGFRVRALHVTLRFGHFRIRPFGRRRAGSWKGLLVYGC